MLRPAILLSTMALAMQPAPAPAQVDAGTILAGRCNYSEQVARARGNAILVTCDTASLDDRAGAAVLGFGQRDREGATQFRGTLSEDRMTVTGLAMRGATWRDAKGTCRLFRRADHAIDRIACLANAGPRPVIVNFVVSRL